MVRPMGRTRYVPKHLTPVPGTSYSAQFKKSSTVTVYTGRCRSRSAGSVFLCLTFALHSTHFGKVVLSSTSVAFLAKGWTLFPIKGVFSATELALGLARDNSSNFRAALPRRNPFVGLDLVYSRRIVRPQLSSEQVHVLTRCLVGSGNLPRCLQCQRFLAK